MRREYQRAGLVEGDLDPDPLVQFGRWFQEAVDAGLLEPEAMTLATATPDGRPSARMVLLRGFDKRGFVFYTNYASRKGAELAANPRAALVFWWGELERQVRIEGRVERTSRQESEAYFRSRPEGSRLSAAASPQSRVVADRAELEERVARLAASHPGGTVPLPDTWGGYRLAHETLEFWQGRPNRLHDRLRYRRAAGGWRVERLAP
jgi:pyridoxamine 5'-phosphate oxidase